MCVPILRADVIPGFIVRDPSLLINHQTVCSIEPLENMMEATAVSIYSR
jgi:hypothetical protein